MKSLVHTTLAGVRDFIEQAILICLPGELVCKTRRPLGPVDLEGVVRRARQHKGPVVVGTTF